MILFNVCLCYIGQYKLSIMQYYNDIIMSAMGSQITSLPIVYSTVNWGADQRNIKAPRHWLLWGSSPVTGEFPAHKVPVTRKNFQFHDVIMKLPIHALDSFFW